MATVSDGLVILLPLEERAFYWPRGDGAVGFAAFWAVLMV